MENSRVLFPCTGNSCRSQMAEGMVNHFSGDMWQAFSAGTKPSGYVHPMACAGRKPHPFKDPPFRTNDPFGLFGLTS